MRFNVTAVGRGLGPAAETMRHIVRYSGRPGRRPLRVCGVTSTPAAETVRRIVRGTGDTRPKVGGIAPTAELVVLTARPVAFCAASLRPLNLKFIPFSKVFAGS